MKKKIYYYSDPLNDDFAGTDIKTKELPDNYNYASRNWFFRFFAFILYEIIVRPIVFLYVKIVFHQKFFNKKVLKPYRKQGYFCYGNHTQAAMDAFLPSMLTYPKKDYIIVNPDATSIPGIRTIVMMLGALPLPNNLNNAKRFNEALKYRIEQKRSVIIYPEAHIWPYYSSVRPFAATSFNYPYALKTPVFAFVNCYKKRKIGKRPRVETYVEGPFFFDYSLSRRDAVEKMRNEVYSAMKKRTDEHSDYEYVEYIYREKGKEGENSLAEE